MVVVNTPMGRNLLPIPDVLQQTGVSLSKLLDAIFPVYDIAGFAILSLEEDPVEYRNAEPEWTKIPGTTKVMQIQRQQIVLTLGEWGFDPCRHALQIYPERVRPPPAERLGVVANEDDPDSAEDGARKTWQRLECKYPGILWLIMPRLSIDTNSATASTCSIQEVQEPLHSTATAKEHPPSAPTAHHAVARAQLPPQNTRRRTQTSPTGTVGTSGKQKCIRRCGRCTISASQTKHGTAAESQFRCRARQLPNIASRWFFETTPCSPEEAKSVGL